MGFRFGAQDGKRRIGFNILEGGMVARSLAVVVLLALLTLSIITTTIFPDRTYIEAGFMGTLPKDSAQPLTDANFDSSGMFNASSYTPLTEAQASDPLNALVFGDIAWMLTSTALVLLMTPGLAFFYGGMVKHKNVISTIMQSFITMGIVSVLWVFLGYSLAFGDDIQYGFSTGPDPACPMTDNPGIGSDPYYPSCMRDKGGLFGNPKTYPFWKDVGAVPNELAPTIPNALFAMFQVMFAIITPALITGGFAERVKFSSLAMFIVLWHFILYCPLAHSVWHYNGVLKRFGSLDYAGGTVVHMSSGWAAFAGAWFLGPRKDITSSPANVPFVVLGASLLWFGWFGFNAGSALGANPFAVQAFVTTNMATGAAMVTWLLVDVARGYKARATGACAGAVVGLVVITPACGFVDVGAALCMGIFGACFCHTVAHFMKTTRFDDTLDAFSCHGVGGTIGFLMTGLFASTEAYGFGFNGGWHGNPWLFWHHIVIVLILIPILVGIALICYQITDLVLPMRVDETAEILGLDQSQHGEKIGVPLDDDEFLAKINASVHGTTKVNGPVPGLGM